MNFIRTFESRVADAFGAAPQGYTAPFSFRKLAKRAAKEMEAETFVIDGVDTAPALFTVLVASADDAAMRPLYPQLTAEIVSFAEARAAQRGYVFVAKPLARFMVDPSLKPGRFAVFAENVDYGTLEHLRAEERTFLSGASAVGGAAAELPAEAAYAVRGRRRGAQLLSGTPSQQDEHAPTSQQDASQDASQDEPDSQQDGPQDEDGSESADMDAGLTVYPADYESEALSAAAPVPAVAPTRLRDTPRPAPTPQEAPATCLLIDHQSGRTYNGAAPVTVIGRQRAAGAIVLRDPNVSRRHAELTHDGDTWHIHDLGSTNGTLVNDTNITQCALRDGDLITVGLTNLEFREG